MKVLTYTPHGELPDQRGFSVALVAQNLATNLEDVQHLHVCAAEQSREGLVQDPKLGAIYRIRESAVYRRLFRKWTKLDPWPLHRRLAKIANEYNPDIIHVHQQEFPVADFRRILKCPSKIILHVHTVRPFESHLGTADCYVVVSEFIRQNLVSTGAPENKVVVVHNGIDAELFRSVHDKGALRRELSLPENLLIVLFFGRKQAIKGFDLFLLAVEKVLQDISGFCAVAIGPQPPDSFREGAYELIQSTKQSLVACGKLIDVDVLPHEKLVKYLAAADVAVLPSREEAQGMAVIEAMAAGLVVVSSNVGGIKESITHNRDGFLINPHAEVNEVALVLADILVNPEKYQHLKSAAVQTASSRFSWKNLSRQLLGYYARLID